MAKKQKGARSAKNGIGIVSIPFGLISLDDFLQAPFTKDLIEPLKAKVKDPQQLLKGFLMFYQVVELKAQLIEQGQEEICDAPEAQDQLFELASKNVSDNYGAILAAIGLVDVARVLAMLINDQATND
ncbi:hypothetical protein [Ralstonia solanacearum]|uniref:hypothetical protein n=1 Tax=Ralstonia solanacearum TaxID=305 RepID=UPI0018D1B8BC|nr:hypothetical protein [Ralstonia solanacearum]